MYHPAPEMINFFLQHYPDFLIITNLVTELVKSQSKFISVDDFTKPRANSQIGLFDLSKCKNIGYPFTQSLKSILEEDNYLITFNAFEKTNNKVGDKVNESKGKEDVLITKQVIDNANFIVFENLDDLVKYLKDKRSIDIKLGQMGGIFLLDMTSSLLQIYKIDERIKK